MFGGAFNPPTIAHIALAKEAMLQTNCEKVIFVPTKQSYIRDEQKKDSAFADDVRLEMLQEIAKKNDWMEVSDFEICAKEQPRSYITLQHLAAKGFQCHLLFGSDKLFEFADKWKYVPEILREYGIVCMTRYEDECEQEIQLNPFLSQWADCIQIVHTPKTYRRLSSTEVRDRYWKAVIALKELKKMVPEELDGLEKYILETVNYEESDD